ncbi:MAG: glycoside hydrolase [Acidobacteriia bacterium]|nr:glycoside hydrolase [Terriglobia bacterium]
MGILVGLSASAQNNTPAPRWWSKYQTLLQNGIGPGGKKTSSISAGGNADASDECGPQSETFITLNTMKPQSVAAGSNEIFRLAMRGYASSDGGTSWTGTDLPLPPAIGKNGIDFGSDPSLAFDTQGNLYYSYIVVYFSNGNGINGTALSVAKSTDGGKTYPGANVFSFSSGSDHFNDKPMIAADTNLLSPYRDNVYLAWDAASGGSSGGGIRFARSTDQGAAFSVARIDDPKGPGRVIAAQPFVGPNGEVYVAWNDYAANKITLNRSFDGGATFGTPVTVASKSIPFDIGIPAISFRRALIYPACDADRSTGAHRGRLYCSWADLSNGVNTDIYVSYSDDRGATWSAPRSVTDKLTNVDRFYQWLSVDAQTGEVNISFYDTRNDTTGLRYMTDVYFTRSSDGSSFAPNVRVSSASSNEHDCSGVFPCSAIDYGNQYGDYEGLVSFGGVSHAVWTDSRNQMKPSTGCRTNLLMEEVFSATIQ